MILVDCLIEKRLIDVFLRYGQQGVDAEVHTKWQQVFAIQHQFEHAINCSIYQVLPGVVETAFGPPFSNRSHEGVHHSTHHVAQAA